MTRRKFKVSGTWRTGLPQRMRDNDGDEQGMMQTKVCLKHGCNGAKLVKSRGFWCCSSCAASYGVEPHADLVAHQG